MNVIPKTLLAKVIEVNEDKCMNCHACIVACPVKYCNDGSSDHVTVNSDMCIACGKCLDACTHKARTYIDDFDAFLQDVKTDEKIIAIVAPSIAASFPNQYLNINGWLKSRGVSFIFDVSFGAELTVKSYVNHIKKNKPQTTISQPCPAIVTYIEIYKPELIKYLAPADSPMLHSIKMIKHYYPEYKDYKVAVVSPCIAKKREFAETGIGDYNIAMKSLDAYFQEQNIDLNDYPKVDFDNPKAERAVLFSTPGGLLKTAERSIPGITEKSRKIEGKDSVYDYLDKLPEVIEKKMAPLLIDCLNCENGCNGGPVTLAKDKSVDEIEYHVNERSKHYKEHYAKMNGSADNIENTLNKYWQEGLYKRKYTNHWKNVDLKYPNKSELNYIFESMHKYSDQDIYNCVSCGYNSCEKMAMAIFNGLNKPENCHYYLQKEKDISQEKIKKSERRVNNILETSHDGFVQIDNDYIIQQANMAFKLMVKRKDVVGRSFYDFVNDNNKKILSKHRRLREKGENSSYELTMQQTDGQEVLCLISGAPMLNEKAEIIGAFAMISDITELKKAEIELRESHDNLENKVIERTEELNEMLEELRVSNETVHSYNQKLEKLSIVASKIDNATIIMDSIGTIEWVNEGFSRMLNLSGSQVIGRNIVNKNSTEHIRAKINTVIEQGKAVNYEFEQRNNGSASRWLQFTITPILNEDKTIRKLIAIGADISSMKEKEFEILNQKEEIESQRDFAKIQSESIYSSITYASRIQSALLPPKKLMDSLLDEYFVLYKPRNIVSGDFYWIGENNNKVVLVSADCTGHGVPGAFMSMLGISFLNEIIKSELSISSSTLLNKLRESVIKSLRQTGEYGESNDGMDVSVITIDKESKIIQFSGAYSSILLLRDKEVFHYKGDPMPIGISDQSTTSFNEKQISYADGDSVYMFSDGYIDQFGGSQNRKFRMQPFKDLLLNIQNNTMNEQKEILNSSLEDWKGQDEQTDDILVLGVKL